MRHRIFLTVQMSNVYKKEFTLEPRHLETGLTSEDFSAYAGAPVYAAHLSSFKHWDILKQGGEFTREQFRERFDSIYPFLTNAGWPKRSELNNADNFFWLNDAKTIAQAAGAMATSTRQNIENTLFFGDDYEEFSLPERSFGAESFMEKPVPVCSLIDKKPPYLVLHFDIKESALYNSAHRLRLRPELVTSFPEGPGLHLISSAHEMYHLGDMQAYVVQTKECYHGAFNICQFYREARADLFARKTVRDFGIGDEALAADMHLRNIEALTDASSNHCVGEAVAAIEAGETPKPFAEYTLDLREFRARIALNLCAELIDEKIDIPQKDLRSVIENTEKETGVPRVSVRTVSEMEKRISYGNLSTGVKTYPEDIFSTVREVADDRSLLSKGAAQLARKCAEGIESFNPDLTQKPVEKRARDLTNDRQRWRNEYFLFAYEPN